MSSWDQAVKIVAKHVVKIATPSGHGTGFLAFYNHDMSWCAIATAAHVVAHADEWQQPIRIMHQDSASPLFLAAANRVIMLDQSTDSAIVLFLKGDLQLPEVPIALLPMGTPCGIGMEVGWLGFPAIEPNTLCFFSGTVSAHLAARKAYLIDGVAIHGVSGGPVIHCPDSENVQIVGCVSAYHANRATGEALPGLLKAQDVSQFHDCAKLIRSIDDANAKKREFEEAQKQRDASEGSTEAEGGLPGLGDEPAPTPNPAP
jgi:hypothetical protein